VAAIPGETLTLPTDIYQATQTPGRDRAIVLCAISAAIALGAILLSELFLRRAAAASRDPLL